MIKLIPLEMRRFNSQGIYQPKPQPPKVVSLDVFRQYSKQMILVSFEPDGISNPCLVAVYARGWDGWYMVEFAGPEGD